MKRVLPALALVLVAGAAMTAGTAAGQEAGGTGTVKGKATLNKKGVPEGDVALVPPDPSAPEDASLKAQTNSKGTYKISNVPPGEYRVQLTTTVVPGKGSSGAKTNCKIKGYSIFGNLVQATPETDTGTSQSGLVVLEVTQNKAFSVKSGGTKKVNISIGCPSGTKIVGSSA
jgi:hypothetical protein